MYDLRALKTDIRQRPQPNRPGHKGTTPYLTFGDINYTTLNDMDVCSRLGLLACGMLSQSLSAHSDMNHQILIIH